MPKLMKTLNNISRCQSVYRSEMSIFDLSPYHHTFVLAICRAPGRSQEELAADICLNKSTVARALSWLEERGYVIREPSKKDRRCLLVYPSEKMLSVLPTVRKITEDWNEMITDGISERELEIFNSVLLRIEERAKSVIDGLGGGVQ